jgi:predicted transposase YbfD/YdcC
MQCINPQDLLAAFRAVPDPRRPQGRRYSLAAILTVAVAALLAKHTSVLAIAEWAADQPPEIRARLGFPADTTPHQSTFQRLLGRLDPYRLAAALSQALTGTSPAVPRVRGTQGVAIDGKAHRGRLAFTTGPQTCVHVLSAVCHIHGVVLAQTPITSTAEKTEAELTVAPALIAQLDWHGRVLTGDALFCQRPLCTQVLAAGGDYLFLVKGNQPELFDDVRLLFDPPMATLPLMDQREAQTVDQGHGRYDDTRHLITSTDLNHYLDWPGLAQVFRLERTWRDKAGAHRMIRYGITSVPPEVASADQLLALRRGHWTIENRVHYVKDVSLGEDQSSVHRDAGPMILAILRDTALNLLRGAGVSTIAAHLRAIGRHPETVLTLLGLAESENA